MTFPSKQKFTLVVGSVSLSTTAKQIKEGISPEYSINAATQKALLVLETMRENEKLTGGIPPVGIAGVWEGKNVQIDLVI